MTPTLYQLKAQRAELDAQIAEAEKQAQREANGGFAVGDKVVAELTVAGFEGTAIRVETKIGSIGYFHPASLRHATPEPVKQEPVGYVNLYPCGEVHCLYHTAEGAKRGASSDAIKTGVPVYLAPQPLPDTVSREEYERWIHGLLSIMAEGSKYPTASHGQVKAFQKLGAYIATAPVTGKAALVATADTGDISPQPPPDTVSKAEYTATTELLNAEKARYAELQARYDTLREKHDAVRRERWEQKNLTKATPMTLEDVENLADKLTRGPIYVDSQPTAVAPKGVVEAIKRLVADCETSYAQGTADSCEFDHVQLNAALSRIVELPEPDQSGWDWSQYFRAHSNGCVAIKPLFYGSIDLFAGDIPHFITAMLAAAEQKEGE